MESIFVKQLLSRLTGIDLVKQAMPDAPGVVNVRNRGTEWHEINDASSLQGVPSVVIDSIKEMQARFSSSFGNGVKMIFSYIGEDPAIPGNQMQAMESDPSLPPDKKQQFKDVIGFMNNFGIRLFMSPRAMAGYKGGGDKGKVNGSPWFFENFGYAWGASKVQTGKTRVANPATEIDLQQGPKPGRKLVQVVSGSRNGGWGIFFKDEEGNLTPITSDAYYSRANVSRDDQGFVDKSHYVGTKGQHAKYFQNLEYKKILLPTQTVYALPGGPTDPNPKPVPKTFQEKQAQTEPMQPPMAPAAPLNRSSLGADQKYYIWPRNDGTLWWVPYGQKQEKANVFPMTKEQVDKINVKNGQWFDIGDEAVETYSWDTIPADKRGRLQQDFQAKSEVMNEIWDYLQQKGFAQDVGLQAYKWCVIGPQFTHSGNVGTGETTGRLKSHYTHIRDTGNPDVSVVKREKWVAQSNEFNASRAAAVGGKLNAAQAMSGLAEIAEYDSLQQAIDYAFSTWGITCPPPDDATVAKAEQAFAAMHSPQTQQTESTGLPQQQPVQPQMQQTAPHQPVAPAQPAVQNNTVAPSLEGVTAHVDEERSMNKTAFIIRKLKSI